MATGGISSPGWQQSVSEHRKLLQGVEGGFGVEVEGQPVEVKFVEHVDTGGAGLQQSVVVQVAPGQVVLAGYGVLLPVQGKLLPQVRLGVQHSLVEQVLLAQTFVDGFGGDRVKPLGQVKLLQVARVGFLILVTAMEAFADNATITIRYTKVARVVIMYVRTVVNLPSN